MNPFNLMIPTHYGPMIVNRNDVNQFDWLVKTSKSQSHHDIELLCEILGFCVDNPVVVDVGACFGCFTLALGHVCAARGGRVVAFEPQRPIYHALCGSVALNGLLNVEVHHAAVGATSGIAHVPKMDYRKKGNFGSLPVMESSSRRAFEYLVQAPDCEDCMVVTQHALDNAGGSIDLLKIDVEGMELDVLAGGERKIMEYRPPIFVEVYKSDKAEIWKWLEEHQYDIYDVDADLLAIPAEKKMDFPRFEVTPVPELADA